MKSQSNKSQSNVNSSKAWAGMVSLISAGALLSFPVLTLLSSTSVSAETIETAGKVLAQNNGVGSGSPMGGTTGGDVVNTDGSSLNTSTGNSSSDRNLLYNGTGFPSGSIPNRNATAGGQTGYGTFGIRSVSNDTMAGSGSGMGRGAGGVSGTSQVNPMPSNYNSGGQGNTLPSSGPNSNPYPPAGPGTDGSTLDPLAPGAGNGSGFGGGGANSNPSSNLVTPSQGGTNNQMNNQSSDPMVPNVNSTTGGNTNYNQTTPGSMNNNNMTGGSTYNQGTSGGMGSGGVSGQSQMTPTPGTSGGVNNSGTSIDGTGTTGGDVINGTSGSTTDESGNMGGGATGNSATPQLW